MSKCATFTSTLVIIIMLNITVYSTPREGEKAFKPEAYAVTWSPSDQQSHDDIVAHQSSFEPEAYPVRWKKPNQQLQGEVAAH